MIGQSLDVSIFEEQASIRKNHRASRRRSHDPITSAVDLTYPLAATSNQNNICLTCMS